LDAVDIAIEHALNRVGKRGTLHAGEKHDTADNAIGN
jgi:hypothetical protein